MDMPQPPHVGKALDHLYTMLGTRSLDGPPMSCPKCRELLKEIDFHKAKLLERMRKFKYENGRRS